MSHYDALADLPLTVESVGLDRRAMDTSSGFERVTTTVSLQGPGERGRGEDVCYSGSEAKAHGFSRGMKPTTEKRSTFGRSAGYSTVLNHQLLQPINNTLHL